MSERDADERFQRLLESDHLHRELLRRLPLPVAIKEAKRRFTFVSDAALELLRAAVADHRTAPARRRCARLWSAAW